MYGLGYDDRGARHEEAIAERRYEALVRRATTRYPNVSTEQAIQNWEQEKAGRVEGTTLQAENWPIFGAIVAGLVIFTFFKR